MIRIIFIFLMCWAFQNISHAQDYHEKTYCIGNGMLTKTMRFKNEVDSVHYIKDFPKNELLNHPLVIESNNLMSSEGGLLLEIDIHNSTVPVELNYWIFNSYHDAEWWSLERAKNYMLNPINYDDFGDNCFLGFGGASYIFILRNNVFVSIMSPDFIQRDFDIEANRAVAEIVDSLLVDIAKTEDSMEIPTPIIREVSIMKEERFLGGTVEIKLTVDDPRHRNYKCFFFGYGWEPEQNPYFTYDPQYKPTKCWILSDFNYVSSFDFTPPPR